MMPLADYGINYAIGGLQYWVLYPRTLGVSQVSKVCPRPSAVQGRDRNDMVETGRCILGHWAYPKCLRFVLARPPARGGIEMT